MIGGNSMEVSEITELSNKDRIIISNPEKYEHVEIRNYYSIFIR
jgi:hypothetical protein